MTDERTIEVLQAAQKCAYNKCTHECDNVCANCRIMEDISDATLIYAYESAIKAIKEKQNI